MNYPTAHPGSVIIRQVEAVLGERPVDLPGAAVRAAIVAEERMAKQPKPALVNGCPVLRDGVSKDSPPRRVVLCKLPQPRRGFEEGADRYVVWYVDQHGTPSTGSYQKTRDAARKVFNSRT